MSQAAESSEFIDNILNSLRDKELGYEAGKDVLYSLGNRTMVAMTGPTASGKTTTTTEVVRIDPEFEEVRTTTTRPHRQGDPEGFKTGVSYADFNDGVINANFVNFSVIGQNAYGTYQSGFPGRHNIGPIVSKSIPQMLHTINGSAGFQELNVVYMLVEEKEYEERLMRERIAFPDLIPRIIEGMESLEFATLNMRAGWLHFVESTPEPEGANKAARKVIDIVRHRTGEFMTDNRAYELIDGMQTALQRVARNVQ